MEDEIVKQWIDSVDFKKLASACKSDLDSESLKKQNDEYFSEEMTRLLCELKENFGIPQCSENQFVSPVEFQEFDSASPKELEECGDLVLSKMSFFKKSSDEQYTRRIRMTHKTYFDELKKILEKVREIPDDENNYSEWQKAKDNTVKQFKKWGIDVLDDKGDFKPFNQIVVDVAKIYPSMSDEDKEFCLEILCGKTETHLKYSVRRYLEG